MTKDDLVLITMVVFFIVMLVIAGRAVLASDSTLDAGTEPDPAVGDAPSPAPGGPPGQPGDAPVVAKQGTSSEAQIWTADDAGTLRPISYPVPTAHDVTPTSSVDRETQPDNTGNTSGPPSVVSVGPFIY